MTIPEFIAKWRKVELKERSAAQEHFLDLCNVFDHPTPATADPTGESFCFEKGASKHGGGPDLRESRGFADVWKRGFSGWEYKGKHKDLTEAYDQLLRYRDALESPPLLVCCDLDRIVIHTNFTGTVSATYDIPLEILVEPRNIEIMRAVFHNPEALRPGRTSVAITQDAAKHFAEIAAAMRERGLDPAAVAHFLDRIVFCLFAEDTGLLPGQVFSRIVEKSAGDPARFGKLLGQLFDTMATGGDFGLEQIRHFNGNLFDPPSRPEGRYGEASDPPEATVPTLTTDDIKRIAAAAAMDWSAVDPSIFGTLFERGLDPVKRSQLGAHFTCREDIELVVDAVVMVPLRREWAETKAIVENLLATGRKTPGSAGVPPAFSSKPPREWHSRGYLPHFDHPGLVQTITFRLADSLPVHIVERLAQRKEETDDPTLRQEIETALDASHGACHLRNPRMATIVQDALLHFDGVRYRLLAWVIMPNHVHVMIETHPGFRLDEIVHSWKSFTAKECNRILRRTGAFWQEDYFDRFIRDGDHFQKAKEYIEQNPVKAKLATKADDWRFGSAYVSKDAAETAALPGRTLTPAQLRKARGEADSILHQFLDRLRNIKILDPACGSGNFLYVALLRLKDLEREVAVTFPGQHGLNSYLPGVSPSQLYGIEVNSYAHDLAQMTVWIGWLQWIRANGFGYPASPILRPLTDNIRCMDAILAPGSAGVPPALTPAHAAKMAAPPEEPDWPKVDFIIGNPPFLGDKLMRRELGDVYVDRLRALYADRVPGAADLCCYWFEKARAHIAAGKCERAGLLATQGIRGGANREVLKRIKDTGGIFWAESDRPWILDGANVHVSMVAFDNGSETTHILDGKPVQTINANLTTSADITQAKWLTANLNIFLRPPEKGGKFDMTDEQAFGMLREPNPHGRPNSDILRPWVNAETLVKTRQFLWIIDYPPETSETEATCYEEPWQYVSSFVKPERTNNRDEKLRRLWWIHRRSGEGVRDVAKRIERLIITPMVSKHRIFTFVPAIVQPDKTTYSFARSDDYFFGVLQSRFHEVWALKLGTRLETRPRYTPTTCFETFPFPVAHTEHETAIAAAAKELNELRESWLNPPDWTRTEVLEFPGTVGGPWNRYIDPATVTDRGAFKVGTVRYPRLVARDAECAARLRERTLTKLYNERPAWLADCHARLDATVAAAYGWPADLSDETILERLLALNQATAS